MAASAERITENHRSGDGTEYRYAHEQYVVRDCEPDKVLHGEVPDLPAVGEPHPFIEGLAVKTRHLVQIIDATVTLVMIEYAIPRFGQVVGQAGVSVSETTPEPLRLIWRRTVANNGDGWALAEEPIYRQRLRRVETVNNVNIDEAVEAISNNVGKWYKRGGNGQVNSGTHYILVQSPAIKYANNQTRVDYTFETLCPMREAPVNTYANQGVLIPSVGFLDSITTALSEGGTPTPTFKITPYAQAYEDGAVLPGLGGPW